MLHSLATGNAEKLTRWAQSLALPSDRVTFFNFLASHDGIGLNPARGILSDAEIDALVQRARWSTAASSPTRTCRMARGCLTR